jgi:hypothetical protein
MPQMSQSHTGSTHLLHHIYGKPGREPSAEEGLPGCCSDDAQVSSASTPSSRWSTGAAAGRIGVQLYPHRFRRHLNHTGLNRGGAGRRRDAAPSVARARCGGSAEWMICRGPRSPIPSADRRSESAICLADSPAPRPGCSLLVATADSAHDFHRVCLAGVMLTKSSSAARELRSQPCSQSTTPRAHGE